MGDCRGRKIAIAAYWKLACIGRWLAVQIPAFLTNFEEFLMLTHLQVSYMCVLIRKGPGPISKFSFYVSSVMF